MGLKQAPVIRQNLTENGLSINTPCAIIERGTTAKQRVLTGMLSDLDNLAKQAISPSLIIVGSVVNLQGKLKWFGK